MTQKYEFKDYKAILDIMYNEHNKHTGKWLANIGSFNYNLKKTQVRHVCSSNPDNIENFIDDDFLKYMEQYKVSLGALYFKIVTRLKNECNLIIGGRIKNNDSILLKLHRKRFEDDGKFSINKYLNDLLGFRIIDLNYESNISKLPEHINKLKKEKWRFMHKHRTIENTYNGYHVYFMGAGSRYFPIELQIWDKNDEDNNLKSHEAYKKDYTYWPQIYIKGN